LRGLFHKKYHIQFNNFLCQLGEITMETKTFDNLKFVLFVYPHPILGPNIRLQLFQTQIWCFSIFETAVKASEPRQLEDWVVVLLV